MSEAYDLYQQGMADLRAGRPVEAAESLERARELEPEKASIREALGIAYYRSMRWLEAEREFRKSLELSPADGYAHFALGRTLLKLGQDEEANRLLELARVLRGK
jgi:Flp pilus assembly protein TadD